MLADIVFVLECLVFDYTIKERAVGCSWRYGRVQLLLQLIFCDLQRSNFYVASFVMNIRLHQQDNKAWFYMPPTYLRFSRRLKN